VKRDIVVKLITGITFLVVATGISSGTVPLWVAAMVMGIVGGAYIGNAVVTFIYDRIYLKIGGRTMFFDPFLARQAHLKGQRVMVFPQDREQRKMISDLTQWTYLVQFDDGQETFAHRTELKKTEDDLSKD
jgi:hypothetical protein